MAVAFDRRQRRLLLVEQHPKAIHIFRLNDINHHSELRSHATLRWPVADSYNHPTSIRMQAAGGFAAILVTYNQRKGNHLVIAEYASPAKPAWAWKHDGDPWAPISYVFRDEEHMLILERNPDYKAREQIRLYNYHFATPHPRKTPLPIPKLIAGCVWNSSGNPASLVEFVPQISVPISSDSPIIHRVDRGEVGDFWNNISAAPIGIKFNANGLNPDTYVCHQGDLIAGNWQHAQIFKAIGAGEQHAMNGMKLISWLSFDDKTEIRVEDFTDGLRKSEFFEPNDSSGVLVTSADPNWTTNTVRGTQSVRSVTTINGGGMESMDVTEDGIVFWRRSPVFCKYGGGVGSTENIHAHMYGL
ncbi:hypothetical protein BDZ89DRAFT_526861 [Hymenopellis radicata]|nr:hypothetical protein BDZ89DRAFT_526861 [Hymenopellis radicata]